jgi:hypothetical protein
MHRPANPITEAVDELPYPELPNIIVAYPSFNDWWHLYDPDKDRGHRRDRESFDDMRRHHQRSVTKLLDCISHRQTGRAVLAEIRSRPTHNVYILPWDFLQLARWRDPGGRPVLAVTGAMDHGGFSFVEAWKKGKPLCQDVHGQVHCYGSGSHAIIHFTDLRIEEKGGMTRDEALLHELVHASRHVAGVAYTRSMGTGYRTQEEFYANTIENVYRSEKRRGILLDYGGVVFKAADFFRRTPDSWWSIDRLQLDQRELFNTLANLDPTLVPFDPIREVDRANRTKAGTANGKR